MPRTPELGPLFDEAVSAYGMQQNLERRARVYERKFSYKWNLLLSAKALLDQILPGVETDIRADRGLVREYSWLFSDADVLRRAANWYKTNVAAEQAKEATEAYKSTLAKIEQQYKPLLETASRADKLKG